MTHCTGGSCKQGRARCETPAACGAEVVGGTYWPLLAESKPYTAPVDDEPLTFCAKACWAGAALVVAIIVAAGLVDWLMNYWRN
jgi:hypothetical protein